MHHFYLENVKFHGKGMVLRSREGNTLLPQPSHLPTPCVWPPMRQNLWEVRTGLGEKGMGRRGGEVKEREGSEGEMKVGNKEFRPQI